MDLLFSQIPTGITTVEELHAWSGMLLQRLNSTLKILEAPNFSNYACQVSLFQADDGTTRLVIRMALEVDPAYADNGKKLWDNIKPFSVAAIPAGYAA